MIEGRANLVVEARPMGNAGSEGVGEVDEPVRLHLLHQLVEAGRPRRLLGLRDRCDGARRQDDQPRQHRSVHDRPSLYDAASAALMASRSQRQIDFRSEEHTSELQSLMRISYAVFCLKKKKKIN